MYNQYHSLSGLPWYVIAGNHDWEGNVTGAHHRIIEQNLLARRRHRAGRARRLLTQTSIHSAAEVAMTEYLEGWVFPSLWYTFT